MLVKRVLSILIVILILASFLISSSVIFGQKEEEISQIQEKLMSITEEEKEILEHLFILTQEISDLEREAGKINVEIKGLESDIANIDDRIEEEEENYDKNLEALKVVLQAYQRMGPGSYIEIILSADSLTSLIRRINVLRDLTKNTDELLKNIEFIKQKLVEERNNLDEKMKLLEEKRIELEGNLHKKQEIVKELEEYLESLQSDKEIYLERLNYISEMMEELKRIIKEFAEGFDRIIKEGHFPEDGIKTSLTLMGIKATIDEKTFNDVINSYDWIPKLEVKFLQDKVELDALDKGLKVMGTFEIENGKVIKFVPESGTFLDMPLGKGTLESLFEEGDFVIDFEPIIGGNTIKEVKLLDGSLEIIVTLKLF